MKTLCRQRISNAALQKLETTYNDQRDDDVTCLGTPSPESTTRHIMWKKLEDKRIRDEEELEQTLIKHEEDKANLDVLSEDVDRLEADTERQKKEIEDLMDRTYFSSY
ncbi:hypothetical protein BDR05DRAFT_1005923 [Suillus weaverae]|nr:hypothetical protein BDR05DRAFT_1005923 [Suillus weaverae]